VRPLREAHLRPASVAILAFLPMFTHIMAVVNNDCLAVLCSAAGVLVGRTYPAW